MKTLFFTGRNPDNVSGVSWKVWKIRRKGRVVETRWGPIKIIKRKVVPTGTLQGKQWKFSATLAAEEFYDKKVREKQRKGYQVSPRRPRK
jgi:predicted DNA-binding WGR domain protein